MSLERCSQNEGLLRKERATGTVESSQQSKREDRKARRGGGLGYLKKRITSSSSFVQSHSQSKLSGAPRKWKGISLSLRSLALSLSFWLGSRWFSARHLHIYIYTLFYTGKRTRKKKEPNEKVVKNYGKRVRKKGWGEEKTRISLAFLPIFLYLYSELYNATNSSSLLEID